MGNLNIGKDVVAIKDVVSHVEKNIAGLQQRRDSIKGYAAPAIIQFYDEKLAIQQATLSWLTRAL
jgi:hypothetical protein